MWTSKNKNDKLGAKVDKRPLSSDKRLFSRLEILPFPGKVWYHIIAITLFIAFEILVIKTNGDIYQWFHYVSFYVELLLLFYFYAHVCYPKIIAYKSSLPIVIGILVFCFSLSTALTLAINHISRYFLTGELSLRTHPQTLVNAIWRSLSIMTMSAIYWFLLHTKEQHRKEIALLKGQNEQAIRLKELEIAYENARINPHFLFNTLQFIYREVAPLSSQAEQAVYNLAEIMRYAMTTLPEDGKVPLHEELRMVSLFLDLARQRAGESFYLEYINSIGDQPVPYRLPPHMLLTLVENMLKHGLTNDPTQRPLLLFVLDGNTLYVVIRNAKRPYAIRATGGMGMQNLIARLEYFYPGKYEIEIRDEDNYNLKMTIRL